MAGRSRPRPFVAGSPQELESAVRERCLNLLAVQPRTRTELERKLSQAGAPEEVTAAVLDRLTAVGLIDDTAYAEAYVRTGVGVRRRGTRSLRAELRTRGVAPEVIDLAAAQVNDHDERATALALASRRACGLARLAPDVRRRRLMGLLVRRGFSGAVVNDVLAQVLSQMAESDEDDDDPLLLEDERMGDDEAAAALSEG
ncbi:MAG TPA: regulatory protein RecX [Frankiaceae bacterium]|nr:regulatory protein RecX [Frankiaceae bacterium]